MPPRKSINNVPLTLVKEKIDYIAQLLTAYLY